MGFRSVWMEDADGDGVVVRSAVDKDKECLAKSDVGVSLAVGDGR